MHKFHSDGDIVKKVVVVWLAFASLYFAWGIYSQFRNFVAKQAYQSGFTAVANRLLEEGPNCKAIPIKIGQTNTAFISIECLKPKADPNAAEATNETDDTDTDTDS